MPLVFFFASSSPLFEVIFFDYTISIRVQGDMQIWYPFRHLEKSLFEIHFFLSFISLIRIEDSGREKKLRNGKKSK